MSLDYSKLRWKREGFSAWTEPETWLYANPAGEIYAKVVFDPDIGARSWYWFTVTAVARGFTEKAKSMAMAEAYVRTHPDLIAFNR